jgi:hypothetical protein
MVLAPVNVIFSWKKEIEIWVNSCASDGSQLLTYVIAESGRTEDRLALLQRWTEDGGILVMGYERFRCSMPTALHRLKVGGVHCTWVHSTATAQDHVVAIVDLHRTLTEGKRLRKKAKEQFEQYLLNPGPASPFPRAPCCRACLGLHRASLLPMTAPG